MTAIFSLINKYIFQYVLRLMMYISNNNFAASIFLFTLVINIVLIPLSIKSQKATVQQTLIRPKLDKLKEKCGDDKQKYNTAMQELYQKENIKMSGGCLPMILRMVLLFSVYYLVISPLTYLTSLDATTIKQAIEGAGIASNNIRAELDLVGKIFAGSYANADISGAIANINFNFLGIDLTTTPHFTFNLKDAELNWIIPFLSFAGAMISSIISIIMSKKNNPDAPSMSGLMLTMPIVSLVFAFMAPCGLGFYWACSSIIGGLIQAGIQYFYGPYKMIAKQRAKKLIKEYENESKTLQSR
ncbi:MAG: membrane protein insertase YidC [Clostridiales bacterium]|nr:membrane protein insertase YidC [Candidatus Equinaster intestinalis]